MEQNQCRIWTKRKYSMSSHLTSSSPTNNYPSSHDDSSWEEKAFAKDAAGLGCIWPPRSYSCSFCRREFRSAQALGGHMNVHRRDRAKINQQQPSSPQKNELLMSHDLEINHHPHNQVLYPSSPRGFAYNNTNPNNSDPLHVLASPSKVLASTANKKFREETLIPLYNSSIFHKTSPSLTSKGLDSGCRSKGDNDKTDHVAVSLNLFVCRAYQPVQLSAMTENAPQSQQQFKTLFETKEEDVSLKKRKTDASSILFFPKSSSVDTHHMQSSQMFDFSPSSIEEVDLELRLGCRPKV